MQLGVKPRFETYSFGETMLFDFFVRTVGLKEPVNVDRTRMTWSEIEATNANGTSLRVIPISLRFPSGISRWQIDEKPKRWGSCSVELRPASMAEQLVEEIGLTSKKNYLFASRGDECSVRFTVAGINLTSADIKIRVDSDITSVKTFPGAASLSIKAPAEYWKKELTISPHGDGDLFAAEISFPHRRNARDGSAKVLDGLVPGRYDLRLRKKAGPRSVLLDRQTVELGARDFKTVAFPIRKGVPIRGNVSGMAELGITEATFSVIRKDNESGRKQLDGIEGDDAAKVSRDGDFETGPLTEGTYEWSIWAYTHGKNKPVGLPAYSWSGEVDVPDSGEVKVLKIQVPSEPNQDYKDDNYILSIGDSEKLRATVDEIRDQLIAKNEIALSASVSTASLRSSVLRHINAKRSNSQAFTSEKEADKTSREYYVKYVEPILLRVAAGNCPSNCKFQVSLIGHHKVRSIRMSLPISATETDIRLNGFIRDGIAVLLEVATPDATLPGYAFNVMELRARVVDDQVSGHQIPSLPDSDLNSQPVDKATQLSRLRRRYKEAFVTVRKKADEVMKYAEQLGGTNTSSVLPQLNMAISRLNEVQTQFARLHSTHMDATARARIIQTQLKSGNKLQPSEYELMDLYETHPKYANLTAQIDEYKDYIAQMSDQLRPGSPQIQQYKQEVARIEKTRTQLASELRPRMIARIKAENGTSPEALKRELAIVQTQLKTLNEQMTTLRNLKEDRAKEIEQLGGATGQLEARKQDLIALQREMTDLKKQIQRLEGEIEGEGQH